MASDLKFVLFGIRRCKPRCAWPKCL